MTGAISDNKNNRLLWIFIAAWVVLNLLQASFTMLDGDEAYYWVYSRALQWGYFDHPPLVALSVNLGETFGHGFLFTRLGTVLFSAGTVFFGFKCLPPSLRNTTTYILVFSSALLFHAYSFIVTPDSSLLFFTALFFYAYRLFIERPQFVQAVFLALSITGLLYSKYHGILPVFFVFISNPRIIFKPTAWLVVAIVIAAFLPHLAWQMNHDWVTFRYHLSERIGSNYRVDKTTNYILGQVIIWGPLTTIPALYHFLRIKIKGDLYTRAHYFNFFGIYIFFFLNSFRSSIEPHWTLAAGVSFVFLFLLAWQQATVKYKRTMTILMLANIVLVLLVRMLVVLPHTPLENILAFRNIFHGKALVDSVHTRAAGVPVVFKDSYTYPSLYMYYYPGERSSGYSTVYTRRNHYDISKDEGLLHGKDVIIASHSRLNDHADSVLNPHSMIYLHKKPAFQATHSIKIRWEDPVAVRNSSAIDTVQLEIINRGTRTISAPGLRITYAFIKTRKEIFHSSAQVLFPGTAITPGQSIPVSVPLMYPQEKGKYRLVFSIIQPPMEGTLASPFYKIRVE